jgi:hypothetical protein
LRGTVLYVNPGGAGADRTKARRPMRRQRGPAPPKTFSMIKPTLLAMPDEVRAYLRRWVLKYVGEDGRLRPPTGADLTPKYDARDD